MRWVKPKVGSGFGFTQSTSFWTQTFLAPRFLEPNLSGAKVSGAKVFGRQSFPNPGPFRGQGSWSRRFYCILQWFCLYSAAKVPGAKAQKSQKSQKSQRFWTPKFVEPNLSGAQVSGAEASGRTSFWSIFFWSTRFPKQGNYKRHQRKHSTLS